jgi:hypothetical protein
VCSVRHLPCKIANVEARRPFTGAEAAMTRRLVALAVATTLSIPVAAKAQDFPRSFNEAPRGPGTEQPEGQRTANERIRPGWEAGALVGGGIGVAVGARAGYSFVPGLYAGGTVLHFFGSSRETLIGNDSESQTVFGGELGYKIYPVPNIELRPFLFTGFGFFDQYGEKTTLIERSTNFTMAPAFLTAYHFGNLFVSAEARLQVAPTPTRIAVLGGVGLGL